MVVDAAMVELMVDGYELAAIPLIATTRAAKLVQMHGKSASIDLSV